MSAHPTRVYLMRSRTTGWYKIGYSVDPARRAAQLNAQLRGLEWELVHSVTSDDALQLEKDLHEIHADKRVVRGREWFLLDAPDVEAFASLAHSSAAFVPVDRAASVQHLKANGCEFLREGGRHTMYVNREAGRSSAVPRHAEITNNMARKVCRDLGVSSP